MGPRLQPHDVWFRFGSTVPWLSWKSRKLDQAASSTKCVRCRFESSDSPVSLHQADARLQKQCQQGEKLLSFATCLVAAWFVPLFWETCGDLGQKSRAETPLQITHHVDFAAVVDRFYCQQSVRMICFPR